MNRSWQLDGYTAAAALYPRTINDSSNIHIEHAVLHEYRLSAVEKVGVLAAYNHARILRLKSVLYRRQTKTVAT